MRTSISIAGSLLAAACLASSPRPASPPVTARFEGWEPSPRSAERLTPSVDFDNTSDQVCRLRRFRVGGREVEASAEIKPHQSLRLSGGSDTWSKEEAERVPAVEVVALLCQPVLGPQECEKKAPLPRCGPIAADLQRLTSYWDLEPKATRWLEVSFENGGWQPAERIDMPYHHATTLSFANVDAFPDLARRQCGSARFTIEIQSKENDPVPRENLWLTTYVARIASYCSR
jgi:hypothetical protein